jgi:hypothetical protein
MENLKVRIPVIYHVEVLKTRRHSKDVTIPVFSYVDCNIPIIDAAEMQIAAEYRNEDAVGGNVRVGFYGDAFYEEAYYEPWRHSGDKAQREKAFLPVETMLEFSSRHSTFENPLLAGLSDNRAGDFRRGEIPEFNPDDYADYKKADVDEAIGKVLKNASRLVVVDGMVWRKVNEPFYIVSPPGFFSDTPPTFSVSHSPDHTGEKAQFMFSLNAWDAMEDECTYRFRRGFDWGDKAKVYIPEVFKLDMTNKVVVRNLRQALDIQYKEIGSAPIETMIAWGHFRDALRTTEESNETSIQNALELAQAYSNFPEANSSAKDYIKDAARRWNMRPITFDMDELPRGYSK